MNTKHTPGPWRIGTPPPNGEQTIGTNYGLMVAVATTGAGVESIANARLIAAAPTMYAFIEKKAEDGDEEAKKLIGAIHATT